MAVLVFLVLFALPIILGFVIDRLFWKAPVASRLKAQRLVVGDHHVTLKVRSPGKFTFKIKMFVERTGNASAAVTIYDFMYDWFVDIQRGFVKWNWISLMLMALLTVGVSINVASTKGPDVSFGRAVALFWGSFSSCLLPLGALTPVFGSLVELMVATSKCDKLLDRFDP